MPEDIKGTDRPEAEKPAGEAPKSAQEVKAEAAPVAKPTGPTAGDGGAAKPAAPAAKPAAAPPKPAGPKPEPWESNVSHKFKARYGSGIEALTYMGQNYFVANREIVYEVLQLLRDEEQFDYCVDITAVHYPKREKQFDIVYVLYSFPRNERVRVKTQIFDGEKEPSAVSIWPTANWLEREVFDMFGIQFEGHPDLRRILLPDGWSGHPLRKEYEILKQDTEWVKANLGIESGQ
jgi:NADH-quinone oxidoreductase subunit C